MTYTLQIIFMLIGFVFISLVLKEQWFRYKNSRTEYVGSRRTLLFLLFLVFLGNFSHLELGHLIHAVLLALVGFSWWYWFRIIGKELADANKLKASLKALAEEKETEAQYRESQLKSVQIHQEAQSEAIKELSPKTITRIKVLTAQKDIEKTAERSEDVFGSGT